MSPAIPDADRAVPAPVADVEDGVRRILSLRKRYGTSGQCGEDLDLIREALEHHARSTSPDNRRGA